MPGELQTFVAMDHFRDELVAMTINGDLWALSPGGGWSPFADAPDRTGIAATEKFVTFRVWHDAHFLLVTEHGDTWEYVPFQVTGTYSQWRFLSVGPTKGW